MVDEDMNMEEPQKRHHLLLLAEEEKDDIKRQKLTPTELFGEALRFELCSVFLIYDHLATADHKLFGTIRVAATANGFSPDPLNAFSDIFNREFSNPVEVTSIGYQYLYDMHYCSLPVDDVDKYPEEDHHPIKVQNHGVVVDVDEDFEQLCKLWDSYDDNYNNKTTGL
nr:aminoacyl-tRNA synthetase, class 1a, anticodon-binding [Tanacetum cinerariifolium]